MAQLPAHSHTGTTGDQSQSHTHGGTTAGSHAWPNCDVHQDGSGFDPNIPDLYGNSSYIGGNCGFRDNTFHAHSFTTENASQGHTHAFTTDPTGSGAPVDRRPAYFKLAFIMKL